jgi:hypothetical protein
MTNDTMFTLETCLHGKDFLVKEILVRLGGK